MTDSSSRRRAAGAASLLLVLLALAPSAPAFAQTGGTQDGGSQAGGVGEPLQLGPIGGESDDGSPDASVDGGQSSRAADDPLPGEGAEGIEVDRLDALDPETIGPLDAGNGGLGTDMWAETPRRVVVGLLPRLPAQLTTPELRALARRLLLSSAAAPRRQQTGGDGDLLAMRIDRLMAMGAVDAVNDLMRVLPRQIDTAGIARHRAEGLFLAHARDKACGLTRNAVANSDAAFWQKALAVCQLARQQIDQANLTVGLLREQGATDDDVFFRLFDAVERGAERLPEDLATATGADAAPDAAPNTAPNLGPLHLALIEIGALDPGDARVSQAPAGTLVSLARSRALALETRAGAAERAAAIGALPVDALAQLYRAFEFPDSRLAEAASLDAARAAAELSATRRRAMLYQALRGENAPAVQAELMRRLLSDEADDDDRLAPGLFLAMADLLAPELSALAVQPDLAWFAETAGRALYAADRPEAAGAWLRMAQQEAIINPRAAAAVTALWPYARLSGAGEVPANGGLGVWRQAQDGDRGAALGLRQALLGAALEALGDAPERSWVEIALDDPGERRTAPPAALLYALEAAGRGGRRGETVLLSLLVLGGSAPEQCHPAALGTALKALTRVGLEDAARRLAIETAIHNGI